MELVINPDYWANRVYRSSKEKNNKIAESLDELANESELLARVWQTVIETVIVDGVAEAGNDVNWTRFIERPEWTIYSKDIPKSRIDKYFEHLSEIFFNSEVNKTNYFVFLIGSMLQKSSLSVENIETDLKQIRKKSYFNKLNLSYGEVNIRESVQILNNEVAALRSFSRNFKASFQEPNSRPVKSPGLSLSRFLFLRKIEDEVLLKEFQRKYIGASGLDVTIDFLKGRTVYAAFNMKNRMCGGFVLGSSNPLRTIEVFASESSRTGLYKSLEGASCCEINCFWLSVKNGKGFWSYWFWILFAFKVYAQKEKIIIYGTIARSLANIYGYPARSFLLHTEDMMFDGRMRTSWIFSCHRTYFLKGVMEIFAYKLKNKNKRTVDFKRAFAKFSNNE
jgi:hypothetical protein